MKNENTTYLLLGSNLGDKEMMLQEACAKIEQAIGEVVSKSSLYETAAWGVENQASFINQAIEVHTDMDALTVLDTILEIELELGRVRKKKWGERIIDIDILYYNNDIISESRLNVPHPEIANRRFTLVPLCELDEDFINAQTEMSNKEMLESCIDTLEVNVFNKI